MQPHDLNSYLIAIGSVVVLSFSGGFWYFIGGGKEYIMSRNARFSCYQGPNPSNSKTNVWTVNYHRGGNAKAQPWLYMVREMGDGWNTPERCEELATRLSSFAADGLKQLDYRPIERLNDLPEGTEEEGYYQICGITDRAPDVCELLLTLLPGDDPEAVIAEITQGLTSGKGSYQRTDGGTSDGRDAWTIDASALW